MDIGTVIGIVTGISLILYGIMSGGTIMTFVSVPSIMIVFGGAIGSTLIHFSLPDVLNISKLPIKVFRTQPIKVHETIESIVGFAETTRREGLLALDSQSETIEDDFLKKGILLIVDGSSPEFVKSFMETELMYLESRNQTGINLFSKIAEYAPAYGMIGTVIGLVQMLKNLDDPSAIGPGMAVALITTFYGALMANLFFLPVAGKLSERNDEEMLVREIMMEGVLSIQAGDNPRVIREKLNAFLPMETRKLEEDAAGEGNE